MTDQAIENGADGGQAPGPRFDDGFRQKLDELLVWRRDVRRFSPRPVPRDMVDALIKTACLSPSVGNSQPWRFVTVDDPGRRARVFDNFRDSNDRAQRRYDGARAKAYRGLKLSGLDDAPVQLAVFADTQARRGSGLGRGTMPEMVEYSVVSAVTTMWLVARARGLGVGWVSILDPIRLKRDLDVPESWRLVAYLCLGYPAQEHVVPELVRTGWQGRAPWRELVLRR